MRKLILVLTAIFISVFLVLFFAYMLNRLGKRSPEQLISLVLALSLLGLLSLYSKRKQERKTKINNETELVVDLNEAWEQAIEEDIEFDSEDF